MGKYITNKQSMDLIKLITDTMCKSNKPKLKYRELEIVAVDGNVVGTIDDLLTYLKFRQLEEFTMLNEQYIMGNGYLLAFEGDRGCVLIK